MIKGNDIVLALDGTAIAAATNVSVTLSRRAEDYTPIPGTTEDDGWAHYRPGALSWSLSHDGLFVDATASQLLQRMAEGDLECAAVVTIGSDFTLSGTVHLAEVSMQAEVGTLSKVTAKIVCDDFPTLTATT